MSNVNLHVKRKLLHPRRRHKGTHSSGGRFGYSAKVTHNILSREMNEPPTARRVIIQTQPRQARFEESGKAEDARGLATSIRRGYVYIIVLIFGCFKVVVDASSC